MSRHSILRATQPRTWREKAAALRYVPPFIKLVWETHRLFTVAMIVLRIIRSGVPVAALWIGKRIVDAVVDARENTPNFPRLWKLMAVEVALVGTGQTI